MGIPKLNDKINKHELTQKLRMLFSVVRRGGNFFAMPLWEPCSASTAHDSI
jgi:hypothetical protein